jgi:hypothetical protein
MTIDTSKFDKTITEAGAALEEQRQRLSGIYDRFFTATVKWAREAWQTDIDQAIAKNPEEVKELGLEGVRKLKAEIQALDGDAEKVVEEELRLIDWGHFASHQPSVDDGWNSNAFKSYSNRVPSSIDEALRRIRGRTGPILAPVSLAPTARSSPCWPWAYGWSPGMSTAMSEYGEVYEEVLRTSRKQRTAAHEKAAAEASDLWAQA